MAILDNTISDAADDITDESTPSNNDDAIDNLMNLPITNDTQPINKAEPYSKRR